MAKNSLKMVYFLGGFSHVINNDIFNTPALATCQPRCECPETIPLSPSIIHMSDEELGCPGNYRQGIIAQWAKFQGNLQKH